MTLQGGDSLLGAGVPPQLLDEHRGGDDAAQPDEEEGQERPAAWWSEWDVAALVPGRHGPQHLKRRPGKGGR